MILRVLSFLSLALSLLQASSFGERLTLPILEVSAQEKHTAYIPALDLKVGESGEILRELAGGHSVIIARAQVVEIKEGRAKITFEKLDSLAQNYFPEPELTPQKEDKTLWRTFYDRALLIAPSQELYIHVRDSYPQIRWQHPDLFVSYLLEEREHAPSREDFRHICNAYNIGILYIIASGKGEARDCQTFALLRQDPIAKDAPKEEQIRPFFSRLGNVEQSWFNAVFGGAEVKDYYLYYDELLK